MLLLLLACASGRTADSATLDDADARLDAALSACGPADRHTLSGTHTYTNWSTSGVTQAECRWAVTGAAAPTAGTACTGAWSLVFSPEVGSEGSECQAHLDRIVTNYDQAVLGLVEDAGRWQVGWVREDGDVFVFAEVAAVQDQTKGCEVRYQDLEALGYTNSDAEGGTVALR